MINRTGKSQVADKTPYELWFDTNMYDLNNLHLFGSKISVHIPSQIRLKWDNKSEIGILVGYGGNTKGQQYMGRNFGGSKKYRDCKQQVGVQIKRNSRRSNLQGKTCGKRIRTNKL